MTSLTMQYAILALDAYDRGYRKGIDGVRDNLGFATVDDTFYVAEKRQSAIDFYAQTYNLTSSDEQVIS
jgi:hypothetical protein